MGCRKLQLQAYFQLVENKPIKYRGARFTNEPAVTGGNPILADNNVLFNDMLGTTLGVIGSKGERSFASTAITAFGESITNNDQRVTNNELFFTGKPKIEGLGYAFLFRNYRANLGQIEPAKLTKEPATESEFTNGKWQTADPLGYPDGWNNLAYVNNGVTSAIDTNGGFISFGFAAIGAAISTAGYATSKLLTGKPITASGLAGAAAGGFVAGAIVGAITTLDPSAGIIAIGLTSAVAATGGKIVNNVISNQSYQNCTDGVAQAAIIAAVTGGISQGLDWSALANNAASLGTGVTSDVFDYVYEQITSALNDLNTTSQEHYNDIFQELNTIAPSRISSNETFNFSGYVAE